MSYKLIDGVLYQTVDTAGVREQVDAVIAQVQPYKDGIKQCERQIAQYHDQIARIISGSGIDAEIVRALAPEKADFLGL